MSGQVHRTHAAESDLADIADYLAEQDLEVAVRFLESTEDPLDRLAEAPAMGAPCNFDVTHLEELRVWKVRGFKNHLIFYRPVDDGIEVVRVLHAARNLSALFPN